MTVFNVHCEDPWFSLLRQGIKKVEGRKNSHTYKKMRVGDHINFTNGEESFIAKIIEIREYATTQDYLEHVTVEKALPGIKTLEEGLAIYYAWNSEEKVKPHGFLALFVQPLENE